MKELRITLIIGILCLVLTGLASAETNLTVCDSGCDYTTLQSALLASNNTDNTIYLNEGQKTYSLDNSQTFNITDPDNDAAIVINQSNIEIYCNHSVMSNLGYTVGSRAIEIISKENITFDSCNMTDYYLDMYVHAEDTNNLNIAVKDSYFEWKGGAAFFQNVSSLYITNSIFDGKGIGGGYIISLYESVNNTHIINSTFKRGYHGLLFDHPSPSDYFEIKGNTLNNLYYALSYSTDSGHIASFKIENNNFFANSVNILKSGVTGCPTVIENIAGNYWNHNSAPFFNCTTDWDCKCMNDTSPYGQKDGWKLQSSFSGTNFVNLPSNTGGDYSNLDNVTISKGTSQIRFNPTIDFDSAVNLDDYITFGSGFVSMDAAGLKAAGNDFNMSANVTITAPSCNGLTIYHAPSYYTTLGDIISNGQPCVDPLCTNIQCVMGATSAIVTFTAAHFDGFGSGAGAVPEFSTITTILALAIVLGGFIFIRNKGGYLR